MNTEIDYSPATTVGRQLDDPRQLPSWVPAQTTALARRPTAADLVPDTAQLVDIAPVLHAQATALEKSTPLDRALATVTKSLPITLLWAFLSSGLYVGGLSGVVAVLVFAFGAGICYVWLSRSSDDYSAPGVERLRINRAAQLARMEIRYRYSLRRDALKAALKAFERGQ